VFFMVHRILLGGSIRPLRLCVFFA
jgi:hypothetical protein